MDMGKIKFNNEQFSVPFSTGVCLFKVFFPSKNDQNLNVYCMCIWL